LYDRLLAGGIQPEFPKPPAPARAKPMLAALAATIVVAAVMFLMLVVAMFVQRGMSARHPDPTAKLPGRFKTPEEVRKPDFSEAANDAKFQEAIKEASALFGAPPQALKSEAEDEAIAGGVSFEVPQRKLEVILLKAHTNFLARGFYLFRYHQNFSIEGRPDKAGLLPTWDKYAVIAAMGTNGDNYRIGTAGVIAWMQELEREQAFVLTGIGFDYMEGSFTSPVKDPLGLAKRMYQFCPDIVDQGVESVPALAKELKRGKLYFWWD
jgi:hypothetical protein